MKHTSTITALIFVLTTIALPPAETLANSAGEISHDARVALQDLYRKNSAARNIGSQAKAVLVFPRVVKGGFLAAGQYGEGALFVGDRTVGYYNTAAASFGFQAGVQKFGYALFFMNEKSISFLNRKGGWELGTAPSLVVVDEGISGSLSTTSLDKGIYVFFFNQKGLMGGLGIQGSKITKIHPDR